MPFLVVTYCYTCYFCTDDDDDEDDDDDDDEQDNNNVLQQWQAGPIVGSKQ